MPHADFVHLRVHSAYSLSEGALKLEELTALCQAERMPAVAVTDRGNLFGAMEFSNVAAKAGLQPIIGCELPIRRVGEERRRDSASERNWLVLLAQNETGYRNLIRLSSSAYLESESGTRPEVSLELVEAHADGLLALLGGPSGPVGQLLLHGQAEQARALTGRLAQAFPGRLYVELMRHGLPDEERIEGALIDLAYALGLPLVATNDVYFGPRDMAEGHDALLCIADGRLIDQPDRRRLTPDHCFRSAAEMRALFADLPEALDNTLVIARRTAFMVSPRAPILPAFSATGGKSEAETLTNLAEAGLEQRLADSVYKPGHSDAERAAAAHPYRERLAYELSVIIAMKFPGYFLIVAEFIRWAKARGIPVGPGRGSGAGSVVAWSLNITDLDPLRFGLLFERFLNPERVSMPDFDIDFCQHRRDEVIEHVCAEYGADRVAQIITFGKLQARAALRDVGRVLGMPYAQVDRLCKLVPNNPANPVTLAEAITDEPQLAAERAQDPTVARLIDIALRLEGLYRNASTHAAGIVIGDRPLQELVPLYRDPRSTLPATQFSMKYVEQAGLVKFDFLGLKTLTVIDEAVKLVRAGEGRAHFDIARIPLDDRATYAMLERGETVGIFQLESSGMRDVLRQLKPDAFEDIIALVALYRPGPMDNIPRYIACKHGKEAPDYLHPSLTEILRETFGVIIYQEQVMQIAQVLAGYSLGSADLLRRAMGKKIKAEMDAQEETFVSGALKAGVSKADASRIFEQVARFAGYGFNKSHAAAYALVAYQTAYLKANYPVEFLAASMTLDLGDTDKINLFRQELDRLAIPLLPPRLNRSRAGFSVEREAGGKAAIRYALAAIRNVGQQAMAVIVSERERNGVFRTLSDFAGRLDGKQVNRRQLENLIKAGAFDELGDNRRQIFEAIDAILHFANEAAANRDSGQVSLFAGLGAAAPSLSLPKVADWALLERLLHEYEAIGFYLSSHPLDGYKTVLSRLGVTPLEEVAERVARGAVRLRIAGIVLSKQERGAAGQRFAFVQLSDPSGSCEVAVFRDTYGDTRMLIEPGRSLLLSVTARQDGDLVKLTAQTIEDLEPRVAGRMTRLEVHLKDQAALKPLKEILERAKGGQGRVALLIETEEEQELSIELPAGMALSPALCFEIEALAGISAALEV